eukprot:jgi/Undpi1/6510/HiC_scaffold_20.g08989.m1
MARFAWFAVVTSAAFVITDAFVPAQVRWTSASSTARQGKRSLTKPTRARFLTTRKATEDDSGPVPATTDSQSPVPATTDSQPSKPKSAIPEDLDYYSGLVGVQPGAENDAKEREGESGVTSDYPIPLPSYLLLVLATVASIAFTGSIFEVMGPNPELGYTTTYIIGALSLPTFVFLFYAAIKKGKAEVEEDDAKFGKGRW